MSSQMTARAEKTRTAIHVTRAMEGTLLMIVALLQATGETAKILEQPQDQVILISYDKESVEFVCKFETAGVTWKVNGTNSDLPTRQTFSGNVTTSRLTVPALIEYNWTRVQCIGHNNGERIESDEATLTYQGLLDKPSYLHVGSSMRSINISWSAPFTLDVTGVRQDIWYSVLVYNVTDENNPTSIPCTNCTNITETYYTFTPDYPSPCHLYFISVIPFNGAGQGENSDNVTGYIHKAPPDVTVLDTNITASADHTFFIVIESTLKGVLCRGEFPKAIVVHYSSTQKHCVSVVLVESPEVSVDSGVWVIESEVALGKDCDYTAHLTARNGAGDTNYTGTLSISTRVVLVEVVGREGEVVVRCVFRHTLSQKCYVQLVSSEVDGGFLEGGCVEGEGEGGHRFPGLLPATYTVLVYGVGGGGGGEESCSPAPGDPDYMSVVTVYGLSPSTQPSVLDPRGSDSESISNPLCGSGVGVGVGIGVVITSLVFLAATLLIKLLAAKYTRRDSMTCGVAEEEKVTMDRNLAYELHKPLPRHRHEQPPQTTHIYEDLK